MGINDYPALFSSTDAASLRAQKTFFRLFGAQLLILLSVSVLGLVVSTVANSIASWLSVFIAALLGTGVVLMWFLRAQRPEKVWFDCRAVAESVKTASWRYMMQVVPFGSDFDQASTDRKFIEELAAIRMERAGVEKHLAGLSAGSREITEFMRQTRTLPLQQRQAIYMRERLQDQKAWYETKASLNRGVSDASLKWVIAIQLAALILAILRIRMPGLHPNPVSLLMTLASSLLAWTQAKRHEELAEPYGLAAQELRELESLAADVNDQQLLERFVTDVEEAISREHTMWRAKRSMPSARIPKSA